MCCRYWMEESPELKPFVDAANRSPLRDKMVAHLAKPLKTSGEIRPTDICVAVAPDRSGKRAAYPMFWGFTGQQSYLLNTRIESANQKPMWKESLERRRCIIPASWYYEWQHLKSADGKTKTGSKYMIQPKGATLTLLAGIYRLEPFQDTGMMFPHFSILTREPGNDIRPIHDRMPVILDAQDAAAWIRPETTETEIKEIITRSLTGMMFERVE